MFSGTHINRAENETIAEIQKKSLISALMSVQKISARGVKV